MKTEQLLSRLSLSVLFFVFLIACKDKKQSNVPNSETLAEHVAKYDKMQEGDIEYMLANIENNLQYELNLGNESQYRYVLHQLRVSGDSPEKSPKLYSNLRSLHKLENTAAPQQPEDWIGDIRGLTNNNDLSDINTLISLYNNSDTEYTATGLSSIGEDTSGTSSTMTFQFWTKENPLNHFGNQKFKAFYPNTKNMRNNAVATLPEGQKDEEIVGQVLIFPGFNKPVIMTSEDLAKATSNCVTAPNYGLHQNPNTLSCPDSSTTCVNKGDISSPIVSCYGRNDTQTGKCGNCNYGYPGPGHPDSLALHIAGSIKFPEKIKPVGGELLGGVKLFFEDKTQGGGCILLSKVQGKASLPSNFRIHKSDSTILNYCFNGNRFGSPTCFKNLVSANIDLTMFVSVGLTNGFATSVISSTPCSGSACGSWYAQIPEICIVQGCLKKGTMVTLADGTEKAVEEFLGGEKIKSSDMNRTVGATTSGTEWLPMYVVATENGKSVSMSGKHAVPTNKGMVLAKYLKIGMEVSTLDGPSKITSITKEKYDGSVHNFMIGELEDALDGMANMYANGILVGDLASQQIYTQKSDVSIKTLEDYKSVVSKEWHVDLENWFNEK